MKTLSIINQKGGVGKTTITFNLGHLLSESGIKVLLIDMDPQSNLTLSILENIPESESTYELLLNGEIPIRKLQKFDFIPASLNLFTAEPKLHSAIAKEFRLQKAIEKIERQYDIILIDTPPNLGVLTINSLIASDGILIPVEMSIYSLIGIKHLFEILSEIKDLLSKEIEIVGIIPTMYDKRIMLHQEILEELKSMPYKVFNPIYRRSAFQYGAVSKNPVHKENLDEETIKNLEYLKEEVIKWLKEKD